MSIGAPYIYDISNLRVKNVYRPASLFYLTTLANSVAYLIPYFEF